MVNIILKNMLMPIFVVTSVISLLEFLSDRKMIYAYVSGVTALLGSLILFISFINPAGDIFTQVYLLSFLLSISLVIYALKKQTDHYTVIGIGLMIVMLYIILKYPLI